MNFAFVLTWLTANRAYLADLAERVFWTFVQGALGSATLETLAVGNPDALHAAYIGGAAAVLALLKGVAARRVGDRHTAAVKPEVRHVRR